MRAVGLPSLFLQPGAQQHPACFLWPSPGPCPRQGMKMEENCMHTPLREYAPYIRSSWSLSSPQKVSQKSPNPKGSPNLQRRFCKHALPIRRGDLQPPRTFREPPRNLQNPRHKKGRAKKKGQLTRLLAGAKLGHRPPPAHQTFCFPSTRPYACSICPVASLPCATRSFSMLFFPRICPDRLPRQTHARVAGM